MPYAPRHRRARPNLLAYLLRPNEGEGNTTMTEPISNPADDPDHEPDLGPEGDDETEEE